LIKQQAFHYQLPNKLPLPRNLEMHQTGHQTSLLRNAKYVQPSLVFSKGSIIAEHVEGLYVMDVPQSRIMWLDIQIRRSGCVLIATRRKLMHRLDSMSLNLIWS